MLRPVGVFAAQTKSTAYALRPLGIPQLHKHYQTRLVHRAVPVEMVDAAAQLLDTLPLAYAPVGTPCVIQNCGDAVYRSTLDPNLYKQGGFDWRGALILAVVGGYFFLPPGVLPGAIDYYILAPMKRASSKALTQDDVVLGKKLGTGGFGTVYKAELKDENGRKTEVIVKKAKEFGEAEVWMNERMVRVPGNHVAEFITAFDSKLKPGMRSNNPLDEAIWLLWHYEGDSTLSGVMEKKDFPYNLEPVLFGRELRLEKNVMRKAVTIKLIMKQLLEAVAALHNSGIVHRDIKPQNLIVSTRDAKIKLIDLGAAADLRVGINYVPNEYLLDPRYAPPQQYIMSTQTPKPPPAPVAALLSPILWAMEKPDRFDIFSVGVTLMQLVFVPLRNENTLIAWRGRMQELAWNLDAWRKEKERLVAEGEMKASTAVEWEEGFEILGEDGWALLKGLMTFIPSDRVSAVRALASPWISGNSAASRANGAVTQAERAFSSAGKAMGSLIGDDLLEDAVFKTGSGQLTESQLLQELGMEDKAPVAPESRQTIAWWQQRQSDYDSKVAAQSGSPNGAGAAKAAAAAKQQQQQGSGKLKIPAILNVGGKKGSSGGMGSKQAVQQQQEQSGKKTFDLKGIFGGKKD